MFLKAKAKIDFLTYRLATLSRAFKTLYAMSPDRADAFVKAFKIYDYDWADEKQLIAEWGPDYYQKIKQQLIEWYSVLNHLCALGQVEKMYIPPAIDLSKNLIENQILFEKRLSRDLKLKKGDRALDIGCGRGRVAAHIASSTGSHITGLNIDSSQLEAARIYARAKGMACEYIQGDLNDLPLPFADNSLDAVYHIQVFTYSKDMSKLMKEIYRVLKPGGRFGCLDWVSLPDYNPKNPHHAQLMQKVKPLIGAIGTLSPAEYTGKIKQAGFEMVVDENASIDGLTYPLIDRADKFFNRLTRVVRGLVRCKILPRHFNTLLERFIMDGQAFVEADKMRLMTTSYYMVGEKK